MTKYMAAFWYRPKIEKVEIEKETDKSVWIDGRRHAKESSNEKYTDDFDEAKLFLLEIAERKLRSARLSLQNAQGFYGNVKGLKNPIEDKS